MNPDVAPSLAELDAGAALTRWVLENAKRPEDASVEALDEVVYLGLVEVLLKRGHLPYEAVTRAAARRLDDIDYPADWVAGVLARWRPGRVYDFDRSVYHACVDAVLRRPSPATRAARAGFALLEAAAAATPHACVTFLEELLDALRDHHGDDRAFEALRADPTLGGALRAGLAAFLR